MPISQIHSYLVHPSKNEDEQPGISGAKVPLAGKLFIMLGAMYEAADKDCDIPVIFRRGDDGRQVNGSRSAILAYVRSSTLSAGRQVAARLQWATTLKSGLGLFFLVNGTKGQERSILLARFPADQGIIAEERRRGLDVQFIERVFMKSAKAYKAAYYAGVSLQGDFWEASP